MCVFEKGGSKESPFFMPKIECLPVAGTSSDPKSFSALPGVRKKFSCSRDVAFGGSANPYLE